MRYTKRKYNNSKPEPKFEETVGDFVQKVKNEVQDREPVTIPREYMFAGVAGAAVLILTAWPVLILGAVIGAMGVIKLGCPNSRK